jgi:hypothetical protein
MLYILPNTVVLQPQALIAICSTLFVSRLPAIPETVSASNIFNFALQCLSHPFVVAYFFDQVRESLQSGIRGILRHLLPVPNQPDGLSGGHIPTWPEAHMPGFGFDVHAERNYFGPQSLSEALRMAFPLASRLSHSITGYPRPLRPHLNPGNTYQVVQICELKYGDLWRENRRLPISEQRSDFHVRRQAVEQAFAMAGIDPVQDSVSINAWARDLNRRVGTTSTATPDPEDLFPTARPQISTWIDGDEADDDWGTARPRMNIPAPDPARITEEDLMNAVNNHTEQLVSSIVREGLINVYDTTAPAAQNEEAEPTEVLNSIEVTTLAEVVPVDPSPAAEVRTTTPSPGITRATTLGPLPPLPRPVRRPTEVDNDHDRDGFFPLPNRPIQARPWMEVFEDPEEPQTHRVTMLSNLPVEIVAIHGSALITSILMLPYDMYYHRMLARTFLQPGPLDLYRSRALDVVLAALPPVGTITGVRRIGMLVWNQAVMFGVQAGISAAICRAVQWVVLALGEEYGWGKV